MGVTTKRGMNLLQPCRAFNTGTLGPSLKVTIPTLGMEANIPLDFSATANDYKNPEMPAWTKRCLELPSGVYNLTFHATGESPTRLQIQNIAVSGQDCGFERQGTHNISYDTYFNLCCFDLSIFFTVAVLLQTCNLLDKKKNDKVTP